jgi:hypothetical protein|tara:strand:- start:4252 stop:4674 length:423 start_codon:yes stop_codon:yes gene_type:complete
MAYITLDKNQIVCTSTDEDKDDHNVSPRFVQQISVSDSDMLGYWTHQKNLEVTDGVATFTDADAEQLSEDADSLQAKWDVFLKVAKEYIERNSGKGLAAKLQTYVEYLESFDKSSLTYPINWNKHCSDSGVTFFHLSQIP